MPRTILPPPPETELQQQFEEHCVAAVRFMVRAKLGSAPHETIRRYDNVLVALLRALPVDEWPFSWGDTIPCPAPCEEVAS